MCYGTSYVIKFLVFFLSILWIREYLGNVADVTSFKIFMQFCSGVFDLKKFPSSAKKVLYLDLRLVASFAAYCNLIFSLCSTYFHTFRGKIEINFLFMTDLFDNAFVRYVIQNNLVMNESGKRVPRSRFDFLIL